MAANTTTTPGSEAPAIPNPEDVQQPGISDGIKRKIFWGLLFLVGGIVLANFFNPTTPQPASPAAAREQKKVAQSPSVQQVSDLKKSIDDSAKLLQQSIDQQKQLELQRDRQKQTLADLQRADAERQAEQQRELYNALHGLPAGSHPAGDNMQQARQQQAYKSLFTDSRVTQSGTPVAFGPPGATPQAAAPAPATPPPSAPVVDPARILASLNAANNPPPDHHEEPPERKRRPLDFDPNAQPLYWLPEGTIIEGELTNRLDGDGAGPVNVMITNDVYKPGTRLVLIPQGARAMGEARQVSAFGQQRLAVSFHRILTPGLNGYGIPLDKEEPGLDVAGAVGLHDKVNNHYFSIFGAAAAVGAIGGLAQIGNSAASLTSLGEFRSGVSASTAQSADRILEKFLNRLPTITIREGTRVRIIFTDDLHLPAYQPDSE